MRTHCCGNFETNQCCNDCPITAQAEIDKLQAQLVHQQASYEAEIKVEIDSALERAAEVCETILDELSFANAYECANECAEAIRALKESKE